MKQYLTIRNWEWLVECLLWAALLAPFIVSLDSTVFPFVFPKAIYIEAVTGLVLAAMVPLWFLVPAYRPRRGLFLWVMLAYVASMIFSSVLSVSPLRAFWSDFERMTGTVFILHTIVLGFVAAQYYRVQIQRLPRILVFTAAVSAVLGLLGWYQNINPGFLMGNGGRVSGTLGNPIYLGGYGALFFVLCLYLFYRFFKENTRWWFLVAAILNLVGLYLSGTRSALGALAFGVLVFLFLMLPLLWKNGYRKLAVGVPVALFSLALLFFVIVGFTKLIPESSQLYRLVEVANITSGTGSTRFIAWNIAVTAWRERPIFGWGPENFYFAFNKFYNPHSLFFGMYETWFDHPHNAVLEALVDRGLVGLILFLAQYVVLFWMCWRARGQKNSEIILSNILIVLFVIHFVHNFFVFDHPSSYMVFYLLAGITWARYENSYQTEKKDMVTKSNNNPANGKMLDKIIVAQAAVLIVSGLIVIPAVRQNYLDARAQFALSQQGIAVAQQMFQAASEISGPFRYDVMLDAARNVQQVVQPSNLDKTRPFFDFGLRMVDGVNEINSGNALVWLMQGQFYTTLFQTGDSQAYAKAEQAFQRALDLSPRRQQTIFSWAKLKLMAGQIDIAKKMMLQAIAYDPVAAASHWYTAVMFAGIDPAFSMNAMHNAQVLRFNVADPPNRMMSAIIYYNNRRYNDAVWAFRAVFELSPDTKWENEIVAEADKAAAIVGDSEFRRLLRTRFKDQLPALDSVNK